MDSWVELARRQSDLITVRQIRDLGISEYHERRLLKDGIVRRPARGLLELAGSSRDWPYPLWRATLLAGPEAVVFRRAAASLWGFDGSRAGAVEVASPRHSSRSPSSHRVAIIPEIQITTVDGLRVTTPARTLADLGSVEAADSVERAVEWALRNGASSLSEIDELASRLRTRGSCVLREVIRRRPVGAPPTDSDGETLSLQIIRQAGLPDPTRQLRVPLGGKVYRLDHAWDWMRLAVEIDGASVHGPDALDRDLFRQNRIILDGWLILRFTYWQVVNHPLYVEDVLLQAWELRGGLRPRRSYRANVG